MVSRPPQTSGVTSESFLRQVGGASLVFFKSAGFEFCLAPAPKPSLRPVVPAYPTPYLVDEILVAAATKHCGSPARPTLRRPTQSEKESPADREASANHNALSNARQWFFVPLDSRLRTVSIASSSLRSTPRGMGLLPVCLLRVSSYESQITPFVCPLFSWSYELLFPQPFCFDNLLRCPPGWGSAPSKLTALRSSALSYPPPLFALCTFRMNTCKSVSKQRTLSTSRMNTYAKTGGGGSYC
jgi:hypothetical protein